MNTHLSDLHISKSTDVQVLLLAEDTWRLEIPANPKKGYRLAQFDDHTGLRRGDFQWKPPLSLSLQVRVSAQALPGTWGFGFWNDPFSFLVGLKGAVRRLPALPQAAWFFHASPQNYLSFRNDLPAQGFLAATFKAAKIPSFGLACASPAMALALLPGTAQVVRLVLRRIIQQDAAQIDTDVTAWHSYKLEWDVGWVRFWLDGAEISHSKISPHGPLSLVLWIDNQYAALPPRGGLKYGTLANPEPAWMEVREFSVRDKM